MLFVGDLPLSLKLLVERTVLQQQERPNPRETMMVNIIKFKPRETNGKRRTYKKAADIIPMPARKQSESAKAKAAKKPSLAEMLDLTWPRATD